MKRRDNGSVKRLPHCMLLGVLPGIVLGAAHAQGPATPEMPLNGNVVHVTEQGRVQMHVDNVPLATVLRMLSVQSRRNIVATPAVQGSVTANLFNVTLEEALDAVLLSNNAGYRVAGNFVYVYTHEQLAQLSAAETPLETRVFTLNHIRAADAQTLLAPLLSSDGSLTVSPDAETGIASTPDEAGGNTHSAHDLLIVYDRPASVARIAEVLRQIDVRPRQVLIEATILRAQLSEDNALGIDFTITGGVDFEMLTAQSTGVTNLTLGDLPTNRFGSFNSNITTDFTGAVPPGGMTLGIIKDHVAIFVRALEGIADTTVIANPKVLALNKQRGEVIVGRQDGYPIVITTETTSQQTTQMLETGTRLIFRPFVGDDGWVRMELHPEDSRGEVVGTQPQKETTEVTTNVMIRDGQTILIGGLFRESTRNARGQVPVLGNIPIIGPLFQSRRDTTDREEVIILLTVHIVQDDAYAEAGEQELDAIERIRVGTRRGIQWTGREKIAQYHYHKALEHYAAGEDKDALWDVRMALHNNPRFYDAILLKEKILNRRDWNDEGSRTRSFIHRLIAEERGMPTPNYDRPAPPFQRDPDLASPDLVNDLPDENATEQQP